MIESVKVCSALPLCNNNAAHVWCKLEPGLPCDSSGLIIIRTHGASSGTNFGPYEIQSLLGAGGMGEVYRARDSRLGREVALKVMPESFSQDADRLRRFEQEARTVAALNHPNILAIHYIGGQNGIRFIVSELLEGVSLRTELDHGPLTPQRADDYAVQIAQGLAAAHDKNIIHRDLKPDNVLSPAKAG